MRARAKRALERRWALIALTGKQPLQQLVNIGAGPKLEMPVPVILAARLEHHTSALGSGFECFLVTVDHALRQAKLSYLSKFRGEEAHPFFWSGFVLVGDSGPLLF